MLAAWNGKEYAASGEKAVKLITKDGKLDLTQDAFKDAKAGDAFTVTIAANGYQAYTFTYKVAGEDRAFDCIARNTQHTGSPADIDSP